MTSSPAPSILRVRTAPPSFGFPASRVCLAVVLAACGGTSGNGTTIAATADASPVIIVPAACDLAADPKDSPACVANEVAMFVDGQAGNDASAGTREQPVKSVGAALGKLNGRTRIHVCGEGVFEEALRLTADAAPDVYGGYSCGDWKYVRMRSTIAPTSAGFVLDITTTRPNLVISDIALTAKDAEGPGGSSVAMIVSSSPRITLRRVVVTAGKGVPGTDGAPIAVYTNPAPSGTSGSLGGKQTPNPLCPTSIGAAAGTNGQVSVSPPFPATNTGNSGMTTFDGLSCAATFPGSYGIAGASGNGATTSGALGNTGWVAADGLAGGRGGDGQGGGGGVELHLDPGTPEGTPGGGGPGGCGGQGGNIGHGGGASIAIIARHSLVALDNARLVTSDAGRGGNGGKGQKGQPVWPDAPPPSDQSSACFGAIGGPGGSGGGGGGGAGGLSVGLLHDGTPPTIDGVLTASADTARGVTLGAAGAAGPKGSGGDAAQTAGVASRAGQPGSEGAPGQAKAVLELP